MLGVLFNHPPTCLLRKSLSLNLGLIDSISLVSQDSVFTSGPLGLQVGHRIPRHLRGFWDLNYDPHACLAHGRHSTLPQPSPGPIILIVYR